MEAKEDAMNIFLKHLFLFLSLAILVLAIAAILPPGSSVARPTVQERAMPASAGSDTEAVYWRVVDACWQLVSDPASICPPRRGTGDGLIDTQRL